MFDRVIVVVENDLELGNAKSIIQTIETVLLAGTKGGYNKDPSKENTKILFAHIVWKDNDESATFEKEKNEAFEKVCVRMPKELLVDVEYLPIRIKKEDYLAENGSGQCAGKVIEKIEERIEQICQGVAPDKINTALLLDVLLFAEDREDMQRLNKKDSILSLDIFRKWTDKHRECIPYTKYDADETARSQWKDILGDNAPEPEQRGVIFCGYVYRQFKETMFRALHFEEKSLGRDHDERS